LRSLSNDKPLYATFNSLYRSLFIVIIYGLENDCGAFWDAQKLMRLESGPAFCEKLVAP
jgi:hypothetical protein